ncbi:MAG TPA: hypothetical protein VHE35_14995 [Kofleriaceae bacterium]|nr:hypothetical protein [Kofleriaceae bacterium]
MASLSSTTAAALVAAIALAGGARVAGSHANHLRKAWPATLDPPFAPSAGAAPFVSLGYREAWADYLWMRALTYFGSDDNTASSTRQLVEAIVALDPHFQRIYAWGGLAMSAVGTGASEDDYLAAIHVLERGAALFPDDYRIPLYAGQIYVTNLHSDDPAKERAWQAAGARWLERAVRVPGAPKGMATLAAHLRTKLGQREQAIRGLRELILYTNDPAQRDKLVKKLASLQGTSSDAIDYELWVAARRFQDAWDRERPELPPSSYILIGPPLPTWFDPADLAVDRDLIGADEPIEPLEPVPD